MKKELLIKFIQDKTTDVENQMVLDWCEQKPSNKNHLIELKNIWISQHLDQTKASDEEFNSMMKLIHEDDEISQSNNRSLLKLATKSSRKYQYFAYAATVVMILSIGLNLFLHTTRSSQSLINSQINIVSLPDSMKQIYYTNKGVKAIVELPDGSRVWLNSDSKIEFPNQFSGDKREVNFSGEGYFEVVKNPEKPMVIQTSKDMNIEVLGTTFNLKAYDNDDYIETTLYKGEIQLRLKDKVRQKEYLTQIEPQKSYVIRSNQCYLNKPKSKIENKSAWKDGQLIFEDSPIDEVIKSLERWYGVNFSIKDKSIYKYNLTATFESESIVQILEMIKLCTRIDYQFNNNQADLFIQI